MPESCSKPVPIPRATEARYWSNTGPEQVTDRNMVFVLHHAVFSQVAECSADHRRRAHGSTGPYGKTYVCSKAKCLSTVGQSPGAILLSLSASMAGVLSGDRARFVYAECQRTSS